MTPACLLNAYILSNRTFPPGTVQAGVISRHWKELLRSTGQETMPSSSCIGHAGVQGNEQADVLAATVTIADRKSMMDRAGTITTPRNSARVKQETLSV